MPESIPEEKLSDLFSLRRSCVLYRDEADDVTVYREWQGKIERIDCRLKESGVMQ
jgi:hypothetical protein